MCMSWGYVCVRGYVCACMGHMCMCVRAWGTWGAHVHVGGTCVCGGTWGGHTCMWGALCVGGTRACVLRGGVCARARVSTRACLGGSESLAQTLPL